MNLKPKAEKRPSQFLEGGEDTAQNSKVLPLSTNDSDKLTKLILRMMSYRLIYDRKAPGPRDKKSPVS